jgi:hypothetical protein
MSPAEDALLVGIAERLRVGERIENLLPRRGARVRAVPLTWLTRMGQGRCMWNG